MAAARTHGDQDGSVAKAENSVLLVGLLESNGQPSGSVLGRASPTSLIDLSTALRLAGVDNPTIALAQERVQEALANQLAARSLLIPNLNLGGNYRLHTGALQQSQGDIIKPTSQGLYLGAGAGAVGSGTIAIPGVWLFTQLADVLYEPLAASQRVVARKTEAQAVRNSVLFEVAAAYLELVGAQARLELLRRSEFNVAEIVRVTKTFTEVGEGKRADANRAKANAEMVRSQIREAEGGVASACARLAQLLTLDPSVQLRAPEGNVEPFRLVQEDSDPDSLVAVAIKSRPELITQSAAIQLAQTQLRQEEMRPWLPLLSIGYSGGLFGGGSNLVPDDFSSLKGRSDLDVVAVWNFQNLGVGNHSRVRRASAVVGEAVAEYDFVLNRIRREVAEGQAAAKTAAKQVDVAKPALAVAQEGFRLEAQRIQMGEGRPIEALDSFRQLLDARQEWLRAVIAFDIAQFKLFVALGNTPGSGL